MTMRLVTRIDFDAVIENGTGKKNPVEAVFTLSGERHLLIRAGNSSGKVLDFLTHAIARTPGDLYRHVQRINLYIKSVELEGLYGALLDLFISLKANGRPLRERMLKISKPLLDEEQYQFLLQHLNKGITAIDAVPRSNASVLAKGVVGTSQLVCKLDNRKVQIQDPLEEAYQYLEYGQIDQAQQVLEDAILGDPMRMEFYHDLIDIYQRTNARESFLTMQEKLHRNAAALPDEWHELVSYFGGNN